MKRFDRLLVLAGSLVLACGAARADELRNIKPGQPIPDFTLPTLDGEPIGRADLEGRPVILVFVSAQQRRSELAAAGALAVWKRLPRSDISLLFVTADAESAPYFRERRDAAGALVPPVRLALDADRTLYGSLGLIVLPTTIVIDRQWRLARVLSSHKADYEHVLAACAEHALGRLDDEGLRQRLATPAFERDEPAQRIAHHRAAAAALRDSALPADAEKELRAALEIDPAHAGAQLDLAALLVEAGRYPEAGAIVERVLAADPDHRRARLLRGIVLYHAGELKRAEEVLTEALVFNPDLALSHYYLGLIAEKRGDAAAAIKHFKESLSRLLRDRSP